MTLYKVSKIHTSYFKTFYKKELVFYVKFNTSSFGLAIQVLPSDMENTFGSHFMTVIVVVFIFIFMLLRKNAFFYPL